VSRSHVCARLLARPPLVVVALLLPLVPCALACGPSQPTQPPPQQPPPYYAQYPTAYPPPNGTAYPPNPNGNPYPPPPATGPYPPAPYPPGPTPPGPTPPGPPPPGPFPPAPPPNTGGGTAQPLDPNAAGAAVTILNAAAATDASGMGKEGSGMAGNFAEGQTLSSPITIAPGKCYTFIAGGVGPQQIEITIVATTPIPGMAPTLGDTTGSAPKVTFGAGANCFKLALSPFPVNASFVVKAAKGGGIIAAQAFSK
jgi:hypothetical protein